MVGARGWVTQSLTSVSTAIKKKRKKEWARFQFCVPVELTHRKILRKLSRTAETG